MQKINYNNIVTEVDSEVLYRKVNAVIKQTLY